MKKELGMKITGIGMLATVIAGGITIYKHMKKDGSEASIKSHALWLRITMASLSVAAIGAMIQITSKK